MRSFFEKLKLRFLVLATFLSTVFGGVVTYLRSCSTQTAVVTTFLKHKQKEDRGIFFEYNPVDKNVLFKELKKYNFSFPNELIHLWLELGGGDLFETYSILHPVHSELDWADDMITHNEYALSLGFDNEYFIFARDSGESAAFHKKNHKIVVFETQTFLKLKSYENITDWFQQMLYWHYNYVVITK